jgi:hypothetical protein
MVFFERPRDDALELFGGRSGVGDKKPRRVAP